MRRGSRADDQRLTIYLPDGAVGARVIRFEETGVVVEAAAGVPMHQRCRFALHVEGTIVGGELMCIAADDRTCRLQFLALSPADRKLLEPLIEPEE